MAQQFPRPANACCDAAAAPVLEGQSKVAMAQQLPNLGFRMRRAAHRLHLPHCHLALSVAHKVIVPLRRRSRALECHSLIATRIPRNELGQQTQQGEPKLQHMTRTRACAYPPAYMHMTTQASQTDLDKLSDRQTHRQTADLLARQIDRHSDSHAASQTNRHTDRHKN